MNILIVYHQGSPVHSRFMDILHMITNPLQELDLHLDFIDLGQENLPYYLGQPIEKVNVIMEKMAKSQALLLGLCTAQGTLGGPMEVFLDHCMDPSYQSSIQGKPLFSLILSKDFGEKQVLDYLENRWLYLQGSLGEQVIGNLPALTPWNPDWTKTIERKTEDFYRLLRQNRVPLPTSQGKQENNSQNDFEPLDLSTALGPNILFHDTLSKALDKKITPEPAKIDFEQFDQQQQEDIEEITQLLKEQLKWDKK